jgi:hypothetical protein
MQLLGPAAEALERVSGNEKESKAVSIGTGGDSCAAKRCVRI